MSHMSLLTILCIRMQVSVNRTRTVMSRLCLNVSLFISNNHDTILDFLVF